MLAEMVYLRISQNVYDEEFHKELVNRLGNRGKVEM